MDKVQHFEIPVDDIDRAKKFYKETFDWKMIDMPDMNYLILQTGDTDEKGMLKENNVINGGMIKRNTNIKSPVIVITVDDLMKSISKAKKNGAKVIQDKMTVGDIGYLAYIQDPEKNIIGIWQSIRKM